MSVRALPLAFLGLACSLATAQADEPKPISSDEAAFFESRIRPVLVENCQSCHGPEKQKSGLRLDSREAMVKGGAEGPALVAADPGSSPILDVLSHDGDIKMPPKKKLQDAVIADLTQWVKQGAPWPEDKNKTAAVDPALTHWAFQPVANPAPPAVKDEAWPRSSIDRFVLAKLEARGLQPSPPASRLSLIRRATFDLIGLPPTAEEVRDFEADSRPTPEAFSAVIDRLLASPHYGERWGRHWLDVARYADTKGYVFLDEADYPWAYAYRDWVVRSLNEDLPYNEFLIRQIAADRLPLGEDKRDLAAMGFLTVGSRFMNNNEDILDDRIDVVTRGLMGLTVSCARCHDHKFDPIPTADYYSLYGVFASSSEPKVPPFFEPPPQTPEFAKYSAELVQLEKKLTEYVDEQHEELVQSARSRLTDYLLAVLKSAAQPDTGNFMQIAEKGDLNPVMLERWRQSLDRSRASHNPVFAPWYELSTLPKEGFADRARSLIERWQTRADSAKPINPLVLSALASQPPGTVEDLARIYGKTLNSTESIWQDYSRRAALNGQTPSSHPDLAHEELRLVFHGPDSAPSLARNAASDLALLPDRASQAEYKKRLQAVEAFRVRGPGAPARAMVLEESKNPVNPRIFRRGNPGNQGEEVPRRFLKVIEGDQRQPFREGSGRLELARAIASPTNPLTPRVLVNRVWMAHFGKPIVGTPGDFGLRSDPPSHPELLDHLAGDFVAGGWSLKALHRKMMLSAAYQQGSEDRPEARGVDPENSLLWRMNRQRLDFESTRDALLAASGRLDPSIGGPPAPDILASGTFRRTIYGKIDRLMLPGVYRAFDFPDTNATNPKRDNTTVAPQALFLMNHPFSIEAARALASRPEIAGEQDLSKRVDTLYHRIYGRSPRDEELALARDFLQGADADAWGFYIQGLLIANEFVFVD